MPCSQRKARLLLQERKAKIIDYKPFTIQLLQATGENETLADILYFVDRINVGTASLYIGTGTKYTLKDVLYHTIPVIAGILGFTGLGLWQFNKKDLK